MTPKIMIGMPVGSGSVPWATAVSLLATTRAMDKAQIPLRIEAPVGSSVVTWARDVVVAGFLKTDFTHLFWIDSDIVWTPGDFIRMVKWGAIYDVIGAAYAYKKDPPQVFVNLPGEEGEREIDGHGNVKVESLGLGFTLVKRVVIERIWATAGTVTVEGVDLPDIFHISKRPSTNGGLGEDVGFFEEVARLGYQPWLDPSISLGHVGQKIYRSDVIDALGLTDFVKET